MPPSTLTNLCVCGSPLLARYDLAAARQALDRDALPARGPNLWRYRELLPVADPTVARRVSIGEGFTPLVPATDLGAALGLHDLWVKDEGCNPTGTFKARGAAVGVARAAELGARRLVMPTAGNAGGAWAAYAARAGLPIDVLMPADAPPINVREAVAYGARTHLVRGLISDAAAIAARLADRTGAFDAATLKEPYRIEGKKTMGYEILEQFGWQPPSAIIYPAGGGVGVIGIWKALEEMRALGWLEATPPRLVIVQAQGCRPLVEAFHAGAADAPFWQGAATVAAGLRVPKARGDFLVLRAVRETGGTAIAVEDGAIIEAMRAAAARGLWMCPEGAAAVAAAGRLRSAGFFAPSDRVVILNTGSGLKYPDLVAADPAVLDPEDDPPP